MESEMNEKVSNLNNNIVPNHVLYVNNLNEKIKINELKIDLYHLFSEFGDVVEINARKSRKMKGQAFIVYKDVSSATNAKASLNNSFFMGKQMKINFAKTPSETILRLTGAIDLKVKAEKDLERKRLRDEEYKICNVNIPKNTKRKEDKVKECNDGGKTKIDKEKENNVLFVEGLTSEINEKILNAIFGKFNGLKDIRLIKGRGVCFVEYDTDFNAGIALLGLNKSQLTNDTVLKISFAKK